MEAGPKELEMFTPNLSILPKPQRQVWDELKDTPKAFVLYGGTALALRLGQFQDNTLTALVDRNGPVKLSFFGSLGMKRVQDPDLAEENGIQIASLLDLLASKLKTVQSRAEAKDYRDIVASFDAGLSLAEGLGAATAIYGKNFNGALSLKALTFFEDGDLPSLTPANRKRLLAAATSISLKELPLVAARSGLSRQDEGS